MALYSFFFCILTLFRVALRLSAALHCIVFSALFSVALRGVVFSALLALRCILGDVV